MQIAGPRKGLRLGRETARDGATLLDVVKRQIWAILGEFALPL